MMIICRSVGEMDFSQLMSVYSQSNVENARLMYPHEEFNIALMQVEQGFYTYLKEDFFQSAGALYFVLEHDGRYVSALRMEPYRDGMLLEALETHPEYRGKGYAKSLIRQVFQSISENDRINVYSHVGKDNLASMRTHEACAFRRILDHAVYIDGSVTDRSFTYAIKL